jgi:hypothetical protein
VLAVERLAELDTGDLSDPMAPGGADNAAPRAGKAELAVWAGRILECATLDKVINGPG